MSRQYYSESDVARVASVSFKYPTADVSAPMRLRAATQSVGVASHSVMLATRRDR
jgi:hypothetical protein